MFVFCFLLIIGAGYVSAADECGRRRSYARPMIHFGDRVRPGEWPWHVALMHRMDQDPPTYACGGTIVTRRLVVTAGHCTYPESRIRMLHPDEILVRAGITDLRQTDYPQQLRELEQIMCHGEYNVDTLESDLAVLKTVADWDFGDYVQPICLWRGTDVEEAIIGTDGHIVGWGFDETRSLPNALQHANMPIVSRRTCKESDPDYYTMYLFDRSTFCAGAGNGTSPGPGDSGGGLYIESGGVWMLRGVLSNGKVDESAMLDTESFIVFTDVAYYMPWINRLANISEEGSPLDSLEDDAIACGKVRPIEYTRKGFEPDRVWPWQVEIYRVMNGTSAFLCLAAIISDHLMLSPGRCFSKTDLNNPSDLVVFSSISVNGRRNSIYHHGRIVTITRHPDYDPSTGYNNIALIQLQSRLKFSNLRAPVCTMDRDELDWVVGRTEFNGSLFWVEQQFNCLGGPVALKEKGVCISGNLSADRHQDHMIFMEFAGIWYLQGITFRRFNSGGMDSYSIGAVYVAYYYDWVRNISTNLADPREDLLGRENCHSGDGWILQIQLRGSFQCYASLISPLHLLTTATCVEDVQLDQLTIRNIKSIETPKIQQVHRHPSFQRQTFTNNLAVLELTDPLTNTPPICLLSRTLNKPRSLDLHVGIFQSTEPTISMIGFSTGQHRAQSCTERWHWEGATVTENHLCGHLDYPGLGMCGADFHGAPLVYNGTKGVPMLAGILDIGKRNHCVRDGLMEVFVELAAYGEWIREILLGIPRVRTEDLFDEGHSHK